MKPWYRILTKKIGCGRWSVYVYEERYFIRSFETTDSTLVDDIGELEVGYETSLMGFVTFDELIEYCLFKIN